MCLKHTVSLHIISYEPSLHGGPTDPEDPGGPGSPSLFI